MFTRARLNPGANWPLLVYSGDEPRDIAAKFVRERGLPGVVQILF